MSQRKLRVGVIGCGNISGIYLANARKLGAIEVVACADIDPQRAAAQAREHRVPQSKSVADLLADPAIDCILNLTIPRAHHEVGLASVRAGKHLYNEKPLCIRRDEAVSLMKEADRRAVRVGAAPDTFLGGGLQTCRELIDSGAIGEPVAATANMVCRGHESWHPDPAFYYQVGGGPMLDMGPYYLTALVSMLGPVRSVRGMTRVTFPTRKITSQPRFGQDICVEVPTHVIGLLDFASGVVGTITTTFDVWASGMPLLEIYGTEGSLALPDPNGFGGPIRIWRTSTKRWEELPVSRKYTDNWRGMGLAEMADAIATGRQHRASGELAMHVLDIMESIHEAAASGSSRELQTTCRRPGALPCDWRAEGTDA